MVLFSKNGKDGKYVPLFQVTLQLNIAFKVASSPNLPFSIELGLGLITISLEIFKILKR